MNSMLTHACGLLKFRVGDKGVAGTVASEFLLSPVAAPLAGSDSTAATASLVIRPLSSKSMLRLEMPLADLDRLRARLRLLERDRNLFLAVTSAAFRSCVWQNSTCIKSSNTSSS
jgi:hypothetical protein